MANGFVGCNGATWNHAALNDYRDNMSIRHDDSKQFNTEQHLKTNEVAVDEPQQVGEMTKPENMQRYTDEDENTWNYAEELRPIVARMIGSQKAAKQRAQTMPDWEQLQNMRDAFLKPKNVWATAQPGGESAWGMPAGMDNFGRIVVYSSYTMTPYDFCHMIAHVMAFDRWGSATPDTACGWLLLHNGPEPAVSERAASSSAEDFAESVAQMMYQNALMRLRAMERRYWIIHYLPQLTIA